MEARLGVGRVERRYLGEAKGVPRADQEDVAQPDMHALVAFGGGEVDGDDTLAGFEPTDTPNPRYVQQHPTSYQPVRQRLHCAGRGLLGTADAGVPPYNTPSYTT